MDLRSPTEAALLLAKSIVPADLSDYREKLIVPLSSDWELEASNISAAQKKYKQQYDKKSRPVPLTMEIGYYFVFLKKSRASNENCFAHDKDHAVPSTK